MYSMKRMFKFRPVCLLLLSIFLAGCASKQSLRVTKTNEIICSNQSVQDTYRVLVEGLRMHYTGSKDLDSHTDEGMFATGSILIPMAGTTYIEDARIGNNKYEIYISIKNGISPKILGELIEINQSNKMCHTTVKINYLNSMWKRHGLIVKKILSSLPR